jgi:hypothetical protein
MVINKNAKYLGIDGGRSVTGGSRSSLLTAIIFSEKCIIFVAIYTEKCIFADEKL